MDIVLHEHMALLLLPHLQCVRWGACKPCCYCWLACCTMKRCWDTACNTAGAGPMAVAATDTWRWHQALPDTPWSLTYRGVWKCQGCQERGCQTVQTHACTDFQDVAMCQGCRVMGCKTAKGQTCISKAFQLHRRSLFWWWSFGMCCQLNCDLW